MRRAPAEEVSALAIMLARNSVHAMQGELETLKTGRAQYAHDPYGLIAASHVVAVEFATIAAANNYWRCFNVACLALNGRGAFFAAKHVKRA